MWCSSVRILGLVGSGIAEGLGQVGGRGWVVAGFEKIEFCVWDVLHRGVEGKL